MKITDDRSQLIQDPQVKRIVEQIEGAFDKTNEIFPQEIIKSAKDFEIFGRMVLAGLIDFDADRLSMSGYNWLEEFFIRGEQMTFAECTHHPSIFKDTYWGRFKLDDSDGDIFPMFLNRNKIARKFKLKRSVPKPNLKPYIDHSELYLNYDGHYVMLCSPYENSTDIDWLQRNGFKETIKIYAPNARTFYMKFYKSAAIKKVFNAEW